MRLTDIAPIALRVGHIKEQLLTSCGCGRRNCTLGEHIWHATRAMAASPLRASNTDPGGGNRWETHDDDTVWPVPNDPTGEAAIELDTGPDEYAEALEQLNQAADHFAIVFGRLRPDRRLHVVTDRPQWCEHHLATIGTCEPVYRAVKIGERQVPCCRACADFAYAYGKLPPDVLLAARHEGRRWTEQMIRDALKAAKPAKGKKSKRRAS